MSMIEKGIDLSEYQSKPRKLGIAMNLALMAMGIGFGLLMGNLLDAFTPLDDEVCYFSMIFLFAGTGLLIANRMAEKKAEAEK